MAREGPPRLFIVVLSWNGARATVDCLDSLAHSEEGPFPVILVDNGSRTSDLEVLRAYAAERDWLTLLAEPENLGFAGGCNVGMRAALERGADYVLLLNNDTTVEAHALTALLDFVEANPRTGLASPLILDATGERIWAAGGTRARREVVCRLGLAGRAVDDAPTVPFAPYALTGCALLIRREVIDEVGLLDEDYFAYVEDVDYSRRAREAGWDLHVVPSSRIRHLVSAASGGGYTPLRSYLLGRGTALFVRRRAALDQRIGFLVSALASLPFAAFREARRGNLEAVVAKLHGYLDGLLLRRVARRYFPED